KDYSKVNGRLIQNTKKNRQITHKKPYHNFLTLFAGQLFNFLLTLLFYIGLAYYQGTPTNIVDEVAKNTPAAQAGLQSGDKIVKIDHHSIDSKSDIDNAVSQIKNNNTQIKVERDGKTETLQVKPKKVK